MTQAYSEKGNPSAPVRSRTKGLPIASSDARSLSYRRLVGAEAIKLGSWDKHPAYCYDLNVDVWRMRNGINCDVIFLNDFFLSNSAPPSIYYINPPIESSTEENVTLACHATGLPDPTLTWIMPDGESVNATSLIYEIEVLDDGTHKTRGKMLLKDGSLLVFDTRVHDQGIYKCVAVNVVGKDERNVSLTIRKGETLSKYVCFIEK